MSETGEKAAAHGTPTDGAPTREQRRALVRALQARAAGRPDPLAANLGVITADLIGIAHDLAAAVQADLAQGPGPAEGRQRLARDAELYLKFVRQIDRLAQLERQRPAPPGGRGEDR
jgi:hypothetical protein